VKTEQQAHPETACQCAASDSTARSPAAHHLDGTAAGGHRPKCLDARGPGAGRNDLLSGGPSAILARGRAVVDCYGTFVDLGCLALMWKFTRADAIKRGLGRDDFKVDARVLRRGLLDNGYSELPIVSDHVVAIESLPTIHKDPFDHVLVAQATVEGITLLTIDPLVAKYPGPIRTV